MKSADRRSALVEQVADHMLAHGLRASTLRALATAIDTSDRMLLYYFSDKADLIGAALGCIAERLVAHMDQQGARPPRDVDNVRRDISALILSDALWPYMRVWLELATLASHGDEMYRRIGEAIGRGFLAWGAAQIEAPDEATRSRQAAQLLATMEGLVLLKALGLDDICATAAQ